MRVLRLGTPWGWLLLLLILLSLVVKLMDLDQVHPIRRNVHRHSPRQVT